MYRNGLKVLCSWAIDRDVFIDEAIKLRARFDAERGCNRGKALRLLRVRQRKKTTYLRGNAHGLIHFVLFRFFSLLIVSLGG